MILEKKEKGLKFACACSHAVQRRESMMDGKEACIREAKPSNPIKETLITAGRL